MAVKRCALALVALLGIPGAVSAQSSHTDTGSGENEQFCHDYTSGCWVGGAYYEEADVLPLGPVAYDPERKATPFNAHEDCLYCQHETCHDPCEPDESEAVVEGYGELMNGIKDGVFLNLGEAAEVAIDYVVWNDARGQLQVRSCDGTKIAATVPMTSLPPTVADQVLRAVQERDQERDR